MYGIAFRAFEYQMYTVQATKGAQVKVQWNGERWGKNFLSRCFMWWKLYYPSPNYFLNKNVLNLCILSVIFCIWKILSWAT
jgi:hypothetical protein